ncbi:MAG: restriction endonuclease subunit S, partial [Sulfobacillus sp.]
MTTVAVQRVSNSRPVEWSMVEVGQLAEFVNGYPFKPDEWTTSTGDPIVRIQNLTDPAKPYNYFAGTIDERYRVYPGDLLISWSASLDTFLWNGPNAWLNQHIFKVTPNAGVVDADFLYFLMKREIRNIALSARGSTMKHVTGKIFRQHRVFIPPLDEQRRIARILSTIQRSRKAIFESLRAAHNLKVAFKRHCFTQNIKSAPRVYLRDLTCTIDTGPFGSQLHAEEYVDDGVRVLNPMHLCENGVSPDVSPVYVTEATARRLSRHRLREHDVVVPRRGNLSRYALIQGDLVDELCGTGSIKVRLSDERLSPAYFALYFGSEDAQRYLQDTATGTIMPN